MILLQIKCLGWERFFSTSTNNHELPFYLWEVGTREVKNWAGAPTFHFNPLVVLDFLHYVLVLLLKNKRRGPSS